MSARDGAATFRWWALYGGGNSAQFRSALADNSAAAADLRDFTRTVLGVDDSASELSDTLQAMSTFIATRGTYLSVRRVRPGTWQADALVGFLESVIDGTTISTANTVGEFALICSLIESLIRFDVTSEGTAGLLEALDRYDERLAGGRA